MNTIEVLKQAHDSSMSVIKLVDCELDNMNLDEKWKVLNLATQKIRHGGSLMVTGIDALEVSRGFYRGYLNTQDLNSMLRPSLCTSDDIEAFLEERNFNILVSRCNNYKYYIESNRK